MSSKHFPTLYVVDGHYPSFRELRGLEFDVKVVMQATDLTFDDSILREDQLQRLAVTWNSHDALVAALDSIERYGLDTMTGPMETPPDLAAWYREGVREMVHRARAAIKAAKGEA